jgi:hypothetical protein
MDRKRRRHGVHSLASAGSFLADRGEGNSARIFKANATVELPFVVKITGQLAG